MYVLTDYVISDFYCVSIARRNVENCSFALTPPSLPQHGLVRSNNKDNTGGGANGCSSSSVSSVTDRGAELKTKRSELRLYCDMIMQQVHSIRSAANKSDAATPDLDTDIEVRADKVTQSTLKFIFLSTKLAPAARRSHEVVFMQPPREKYVLQY